MVLIKALTTSAINSQQNEMTGIIGAIPNYTQNGINNWNINRQLLDGVVHIWYILVYFSLMYLFEI